MLRKRGELIMRSRKYKEYSDTLRETKREKRENEDITTEMFNSDREEIEQQEEKQKKENEIAIRGAGEFKIDFPKNDVLEEKEQKKIQDAVLKGGVALAQKTFVNSDQLSTIFNTDKKGVQMVLNNAPKEDVKQLDQLVKVNGFMDK